MAEFKFEWDPEDKNEKKFREQFNLREGREYLPMEKNNYPLMPSSKEKIESSFKEYLNMDYSYELVQEVLEEIHQTKKCTLEQADTLNTNFAKLLVGIYQLNKRNLHCYYFKKLKNSDYEVLNRSLLSLINSNLTFDDICNDAENNKDVKKQIYDLSGPVFREALNRDIEVCLNPRNDEFMHLFALQTSIAYGYIIGRDLKKRIRSNRYFTFELLDDIEYQVISDIYGIFSLTYPYNGSIENFNLNDLFPIQRKMTKYANEIKKFIGKDWKEKADWLNSKLEEIELQKRVLTTDEKQIFESLLFQITQEINVPQQGEDLETTRQKYRDIVLDSYFKVFLAHYSGDVSGYERNMEVTKKMLLKLIYIVDFEKSRKDVNE
ncbi:MAG: hypothetical protein QXO35_01725 [Candidatus Micrarchaeia archaeon]